MEARRTVWNGFLLSLSVSFPTGLVFGTKVWWVFPVLVNVLYIFVKGRGSLFVAVVCGRVG